MTFVTEAHSCSLWQKSLQTHAPSGAWLPRINSARAPLLGHGRPCMIAEVAARPERITPECDRLGGANSVEV